MFTDAERRAVEAVERFLDKDSQIAAETPVSSSSGQESPTLGAPTGPSDQPVHPPPGYEILGELGRGGMGVVCKARHLRLNRTVALKVILAGDHAGPSERLRFLAEAEVVAALQHLHLVALLEYSKHQGQPFLRQGNLGRLWGRQVGHDDPTAFGALRRTTP